MKLAAITLILVLTSSLLGCSRFGTPSIVPLGAEAPLIRAKATGFKTIFQFNGTNGGDPEAALTIANGTFYGTTKQGGAYGKGTVFSLTTTGEEHRIYSFGSGNDGNNPVARLIAVNGALYGTTYKGGNSDNGTVFRMSTAGKERWLYSFKAGADGVRPAAGLTNVQGTLYGTTEDGGAFGGGTLFKITQSGMELVVHSFGLGKNDGTAPVGDLVLQNGTLYGTTITGGASGKGTVFLLTGAGTEIVIYNFGDKRGDGGYPFAGLTILNGILYGTTHVTAPNYNNYGTVFGVTKIGKEHVLHNFDGPGDGRYPDAGVIGLQRILYGTTSEGGSGTCRNNYGLIGCGTVYSLNTGGSWKVLYSFTGGRDGAYPVATVTALNGTLYGTTSANGAYGEGTVFKISP